MSRLARLPGWRLVLAEPRISAIITLLIFVSLTTGISAQPPRAYAADDSWRISDAQLKGDIDRDSTRIEMLVAEKERLVAKQDSMERELGRIEGAGMAVSAMLIGLNVLGLIRKAKPEPIGRREVGLG